MGMNSTVPVDDKKFASNMPEEWTLTELAIYPTHELVHHCSQILVLLHILAARHSDLHKHHLANPFRMVTEKHLQRVQFLGHTLDVVEPVDTDHQLHALELLFQHGNPFLHLLLFQALLELLRINANREGAAGDDLALEFNAVWSRSKPPVFIPLALDQIS